MSDVDPHVTASWNPDATVRRRARPAAEEQAAAAEPGGPQAFLRLDSGHRIPIAGVVLVGRSPQSTTTGAPDEPSLVRVTDPGVSRTHLRLLLDGQRLRVRDLGSSNGTQARRPGYDLQQLSPYVDYLVEPGTELVLAGEIRLVFEIDPEVER